MQRTKPKPGSRISFNGSPATLKYVGPVDNTNGVWLGVDWDDPERGKHDGVKDNKRYFTARSLRSGSFIRPSANVHYGVTFIQAIRSKYLEELHGSNTQETVILGSSLGAIEVEAVNLDKIRSNLSRLDRLKDVSLDETLVAYADVPGEGREICPNIRSLNLSLSLVNDWNQIALITTELAHLQSLSLNRNRLLPPPEDKSSFAASFNYLTELELNGTHMDWAEIPGIIAQMPSLRSLEAGFNGFTTLGGAPHSHPQLQTLNLAQNELTDWQATVQSIGSFPLLDKAVLSSNKVALIPAPEGVPWSNLKYLSLADNMVSKWLDVHNLSLWCPALQVLSFRDNPIMVETHARAFVISYFPTLLILDGTTIPDKERSDAERLYLGDVAKTLVDFPDPFRWNELGEKHGKPQTAPKPLDEEKLGSRLMALHATSVSETPTKHTVLEQDAMSTINVLPTMALRSLRTKVKRATGQRSKKVRIWIQMRDGSYVELEETNDTHTLDWIGLEAGTQIVYRLE